MPLVTPARVRAVYTMLREMPPFSRWGLPPASEVRFYVIRDPKDDGGYNTTLGGKHLFGVNPETHWSLMHIQRSVAHEMCHMRQELLGRRPATKDEQHNREFRRLGRLVCRDLGFDSEHF